MLIDSNHSLSLEIELHNVLAQKMLNQDEIFRNQVVELHRVYQIQKIMMKDLHRKPDSQERAQSFVGPFSDHLKYESRSTEMKSSEVHTPCSSVSMKSLSLHQQRSLDLQLPASHYLDDNEDLCVAPEVSATMMRALCYEDVSSIPSPSRWTVGLQGSAYSDKLVKFGAKGSFRNRKNGAFDCISGSHLRTHAEPNLLQRQYVDQGGEQSHDHLSCRNTSGRRELFTSHEDGLLDLNKALPEESFVLHNEVGEHDKGSISTAKNSCSNEPSALALDQPDTMNSTLTTNSSYPYSDNKDPKAESDLSLPDKINPVMSMPETNNNKNNEEVLERTGSNKSSVSYKSNTGDVSINNKTGDMVVLSVETNHHSCDEKKQELAEVDSVVRKGAASLMYFSLECPNRTQNYVRGPRKRKQNSNMEKAMSESSSESFESIVLRQPKCDVDYCVSSAPTEVTTFDGKNHGVKLRRGRRMKDFRKEILPELTSLSRQEIREDVKTMELAIRSREYKKYRSKIGSKSEFLTSVRSRRTRLSYVGRRYYS